MKLLKWRCFLVCLTCFFGSLAQGYSCLVKEQGADVSPVLAKTLLGPIRLAELHEKQSASIEVWRAEEVLWSFTRTSIFLGVEARKASGELIKSARVREGEELVVSLESHGQNLDCHYPPKAESTGGDSGPAHEDDQVESFQSAVIIPTDILEFFGQGF
ncbi:MAG: hypothetical protein IPJ71_04945 [Bdellovibrionales bacterium]|nr:hypothetical protein [Bdellovibrionales bacterium]